MMGLMVAWTAVQGDWQINLTGNPLWSYYATTTWGGLTPYTYTYATSRFTGNLGWLAHTDGDTLQGRWQMGFSPQEVTTLWMRYARDGLEVQLGDLDRDRWSLPIQNPRARGTVVRFREGALEGEGLWFFPQGTVHLDRIPGNNTQGPFRLSQAPLIPGSEEVFLVQEGQRTRLVRGKDYTVDYWVGEVALLHRVLYTEEFLEVRYGVEGEGTGVQAAGLRYTSGPFAFGGGAWQIYGPGGFRDAPGGFLDFASILPFTTAQIRIAGVENQGITYGAATHTLTLGPWTARTSGIWRRGTTPLPGEGPLQVRERIDTRQTLRMGAATFGAAYTHETGIQEVRALEGWLDLPFHEGDTFRITATRRDVRESSRREGLRMEGVFPNLRLFLARYSGYYTTRGIQPGVWWEGGVHTQTSYRGIRATLAFQTEIQSTRHQENLSASIHFPQNILTLQLSGRRTFHNLWLATLSGSTRLGTPRRGLSLQASRTFRSDRYLLEPSHFWRASAEGWLQTPSTQIRTGGTLQQGERMVTDTGGVLSRNHQVWATFQSRGIWGTLQASGIWQRFLTLIPVEGETRSRIAQAQWFRKGQPWSLTGTVHSARLEGWTTGGYSGSQSAFRTELGVIRESSPLRMGLAGVYADTGSVDTSRFHRTYTGIQIPTQTWWGLVHLTLQPEIGRGQASWNHARGTGWIYRLALQALAGGSHGRIWIRIDEEQTTFGLYRLRRIESGTELRWKALRTGGTFLLEEDRITGRRNHTLALHLGGVF